MRILVYDDEPRLSQLFTRLVPDGEVLHVDSRDALFHALDAAPDLLVVDVYFQEAGAQEGVDAMEEVIQRWTGQPFPIWVISRYLDRETWRPVSRARRKGWPVEAMEYDVEREDFFIQEVVERLERIRARQRVSGISPKVVQWYENQILGRYRFVARSPALQNVLQRIEEILASDTCYPLVLLGETGVGKTYLARLVARRIHAMRGTRGEVADKDPTVIVLNCANYIDMDGGVIQGEFFGISRGAYGNQVSLPGVIPRVSEHKGVLVLDEFQYLPSEVQHRLLHLLDDPPLFHPFGSRDPQPRPFQGRVILCSTWSARDLHQRIDAALWNRLRFGIVYIPPLRERREDIAAFLEENLLRRSQVEITQRAWRYLVEEYPWPGNMRELVQVTSRLQARRYVDFGAVYPSPWGEEGGERIGSSVQRGQLGTKTDRDHASTRPGLRELFATLEEAVRRERLSLEDVGLLWVGYLLERYRSVDRILEIFPGGQGFSRATLFRKREQWAQRRDLHHLLKDHPVHNLGT